MSVSTTTSTQRFTLDGTTRQFDFTFRALYGSPTDIKAKSLTGSTESILAYTSQYTITVSTDGSGGTLWLVSASAVSKGTLTVYRDTTNLQSSDYDDYNQFPANTLENDLDKRTMVDQEQANGIERSLRLPISVTGVTAELPIPVASQLIGWNATATGLLNYTAASAVLPTILTGDGGKILRINAGETGYEAADNLAQLNITRSTITSLTAGSMVLTSATISGNSSVATVTASNVALTNATISGNISATTLTATTAKIDNQISTLTVNTISLTSATISGNVSASTLTASTIAITTSTVSGTASTNVINLTGGQIVFPGTQNPSTGVNTLDDYEEGTWTPAYTSSGGTFYYSTQLGVYTKIGRLVHASYFIQTSAATIGTGGVTISGLPFTVNNSDASYGSHSVRATSFGGDHPISVIANKNATTFIPYYRTAVNGADVQLDASDLSTGSGNILIGTITYEATA